MSEELDEQIPELDEQRAMVEKKLLESLLSASAPGESVQRAEAYKAFHLAESIRLETLNRVEVRLSYR